MAHALIANLQWCCLSMPTETDDFVYDEAAQEAHDVDITLTYKKREGIAVRVQKN